MTEPRTNGPRQVAVSRTTTEPQVWQLSRRRALQGVVLVGSGVAVASARAEAPSISDEATSRSDVAVMPSVSGAQPLLVRVGG